MSKSVSISSDLILAGLPNIPYTGVQCNSKLVQKGHIFVAISGNSKDGHLFIQEAINKGASCIVGEQDLTGLTVPYIKVANSRKILGLLAASFYQFPSNKHQVIAVTGTNGKTTTAHLIKHLINFSGESCSLIGTVGHEINNRKISATNTTPDALLLQQLLDESNDQFVVMEASSHGIDQYRLEGTSIDYGLFTNLSHEHLDYHGSLEKYFAVKARLFQYLRKNGEAVVGSYSPWGVKMKEQLKELKKPVFSIGEHDHDDIQLVGIESFHRPIFHMKEGVKHYKLLSPLPGLHNIWNTMQAFLVARRIGMEASEIIDALQTFRGVAGRHEYYRQPKRASVVVDYAHTPDALHYCLSSIKEETSGKIIHIFGFRGNRDRLKRKGMLEVSLAYSDLTILTFDDLNGESKDSMLNEMTMISNLFNQHKCMIIEDRTKAIEFAWETAKEEDTIAITGKGPERYEQPFLLPSFTDADTIQYLRQQ